MHFRLMRAGPLPLAVLIVRDEPTASFQAAFPPLAALLNLSVILCISADIRFKIAF